MVRPERRTKADLAAVALVVVAVLVGTTVLWLNSDSRSTVSETAQAPPARLEQPSTVPDQLSEVWRAPSPATPVPVVVGSSVVTGSGGEVVGRDPVTGEQRWRYARDLPLCTIGAEWNHAIAVHRKGDYCSEVTSLEGSSGERGPQRNGDAQPGTRLLSDGTYVTATGRQTIESWRSDLVRTQQYGLPEAIKNPDNNIPRPGCQYASTAIGSNRVAFVEECPREFGDRLTVIKAHPEDDEKPEEIFSLGVGSQEADVVGVTKTHTAVLLRERALVLVYNNSTASVQHQFTVPEGVGPAPEDGVEATSPRRLWTVSIPPAPEGGLDRASQALARALSPVDPKLTPESIRAGAAAAPPGQPYQVMSLDDAEYDRVEEALDEVPGVDLGGIAYWYTGAATGALDADSLTPLWTVPDTRGPGTLFGDSLVVPVADGLALHDPTTGAFKRLLPVDRQGYPGLVSLDSAGDVLLEQRGDTVVALR